MISEKEEKKSIFAVCNYYTFLLNFLSPMHLATGRNEVYSQVCQACEWHIIVKECFIFSHVKKI